MRQHTLRLILTTLILAVIIILVSACIANINIPPKISEIRATQYIVYPKGTVDLECIASDSEDGNLTFRWLSTDGEIVGNGAVATWKAPNKYGDVHIMVVVEDEDGGSSQESITIDVVVNENTKTTCCD
jgi:hypothetical protein